MSDTGLPTVPTGNAVALGVPDSQDYPRLVFSAPYFETVAIAEIIQPSVTEAVENALPALVPPYVDGAVTAGIQSQAVLLTGSTMSGALYLNPTMPTQPSQAASMAYVDAMVATAGVPEVPPVPIGQIWGRETGQWVPIAQAEGTFLPLTGGTMQGQINMSGNTIVNMAAIPVMPNGAAPAQWVLNQIAAQSLYQGTWIPDTNTPDLTQPSTHQNGFTWIATTSTTGGVVIGPAIPGLQGQTVFNGDTVIYSANQGVFNLIHAGGMSFEEAQALFLPFTGGQMSGALLLNANATQPTQAVTFQQLNAAVANVVTPDAPTDGQLYGRNGLTKAWSPVLPLAGGILTGALTLAANAVQPLQPVPLQQMTGAVSAAQAASVPLAGGTMSGPLILSGNAVAQLGAVPLQQVSSMVNSYLPLGGGTLTGPLNGTSASFSGSITTGGGIAVGGAALGTGAAASAIMASAAGIYLPNTASLWGMYSGTPYSLIYMDSSGDIRINASGVPGTVNCQGALAVGGNASVNTIAFGYYSNNWTWAFNWVNDYGGSNANAIIAAPNGQEQALVTALDVAEQWFPPVAMGVMGGGASISCNVAFAGPGYVVSWPVNNTSDRRLKTNITAPTKDALEVINSLAVYASDMPARGTIDQNTHYDFCFMADEVKPIVPPAWCGSETNPDFMAILNPLHLVPVLWKAVQDLSAKVAALEAAAA